MRQRTQYLLDTNICSYIAKARKNGAEQNHAVKRHFLLNPDLCYISAITHQELITWISLSTTPEWQRENVRQLLRTLESRIINFDDDVSKIAGTISAKLQQSGQKLEMADIQIAATALNGGFIFVTHDSHFNRIQGLHVVDWYKIPLSEHDFLRRLRNTVFRLTLAGSIFLAVMTLCLFPFQEASIIRNFVNAPNLVFAIAVIVFFAGMSGAFLLDRKLKRVTTSIE